MEALFREHYQALCLSANFIVTDAEAAKDIVQEFFCYCWNKRGQLGLIHNFRHYASRAVKNACLNYLKQSKRNIPYDNLFGEALSTDEAADREQQQTQASREQALWSVIARLPEQRRIIFLLSNKDDLSYAQIASRLNISVNTVKTQIRLAYQFLRQECAGLLLAWIVIFINNFL
ncbi:RNA polymerase sigma-70 factor [Flavitalea flava]